MQKALIGTASLGLIAVGTYFIFFADDEDQKKKHADSLKFQDELKHFERKLPRNIVLEAMQDLANQLFPLYFTISQLQQGIVNKSKEQFQRSEGSAQMSAQQIEIGFESIKKEAYAILKPEFIKIVQTKEDMVHRRYKIQSSDMRLALEKFYLHDKEIQKITLSIYDNIENALKGIEPELSIANHIRTKFSEDKCLEALTKISQDAGNKLRDMFESLKDKQIPNLDISELQNPVMMDFISKIDLPGSKRRILEELGFNQFHPQNTSLELIGKLTQIYKKESKAFQAKVSELDTKTNILMDVLMSKDRVSNNFVNDVYENRLDITNFQNQAKEVNQRQTDQNSNVSMEVCKQDSYVSQSNQYYDGNSQSMPNSYQ